MVQRVYQIQSGTRRQPISPELESLLNKVGNDLGVYFEVTSGGQPSSGPDRVGSHRHDDGGAADTKAFVLNSDGSRHYLDISKPADQAMWANIISAAHAGGATGIGMAPGYMGNETAHIGFGTPAVWGAGGASANAPDWVKTAYNSAPSVSALNAIDAAAPTPMALPLAFAAAPPPLPIPRPAPPSKAPAAPGKSMMDAFNIPGVLNVSRELSMQPDASGHYPTMASGYIHRAINDAIKNAPAPDMAAAGNSLKATGANIVAPITGAFQGLGNSLGSLFSAKPAPVPPAPIPTPAAAPSLTPQQRAAISAVPPNSYQAPIQAPMTPPLAPGLTAAQKYAMSAVPPSAYMPPIGPLGITPQLPMVRPQVGTPPGTRLNLTTSRPSAPPPIMTLLASGNRAQVGATTPHGGKVNSQGGVDFNWGSVPGPGQPQKWWQINSAGGTV